jgi:phage shock protein C
MRPMDEPISVRLTGHAAAFPATRDARDALRSYLDGARRQLLADPDADEIVRDLETAIGDRLGARTGPVTGAEMAAILAELGPVRPTLPTAAGRPRGPFWCRINEGKWFGGICLGIAARGEFGVEWMRTVVLLLTLVTGGSLGVVYLILLLFLPVVPSVAEYQRLRDAPVT